MATNTENLENSITDRVVLPVGSERQHKAGGLSEGLMRWVLGLDLQAPRNRIEVDTEYRPATPERPPVVVVHVKHSTTQMFSFIVEPEDKT